MLQNIGSTTLWKVLVYSFYICTQIMVLGSLLLTTTNMIIHLIFMILTVGFYFGVCLKNPGVYQANTEPNLQDISVKDIKNLSSSKSQKNKKTSSLNVLPNVKMQTLDKFDKDEINMLPNDSNMRKKTSIQAIDTIIEHPVQSKQKQLLKQSVRLSNSLKIQHQHKERKSNLFINATNMLKNAFQTFTNYKSKKNIDQQENNSQKKQQNQENRQTQSNNDQGTTKRQQERELSFSDFQNIEKMKKSVINTNEHEERKEKQVEKQEKIVIRTLEVNDQIVKDKEGAKGIDKKNVVLNKMMKIKRYCRICQFYQPFRVKHCYSCDQCISTYDHHCPWLATCIGQKNKVTFLLYLFFQSLQFLVILIDLIRHLSVSQLENTSSIRILLISVLLFTIVLFSLFIFHAFLVCNNLTTWQLFRWNKISYLAIFDYEKTKSPFSKGWKNNLKMLWRNFWAKENKIWAQEVSEELGKVLVHPTKKKIKSERHIEGETDRKIHSSNRDL